MNIIIVGGGAAGLLAALLLARADHQVTILEQDHLEPGSDIESAAASAFRWTAPQIVQPHIIMARCRQLLCERLPDIYAALLAAATPPQRDLRHKRTQLSPQGQAWQRLT